MVQFALNHMTVARLGFTELVTLAADRGCTGIEVRNDLPQPLFDGMDPAKAGEMIRAKGLRLLAVAEVKRFNDWSEDKGTEALALMKIAQAAGAEAVSLIPRNDNLGMGNGERQAALRDQVRWATKSRLIIGSPSESESPSLSPVATSRPGNRVSPPMSSSTTKPCANWPKSARPATECSPASPAWAAPRSSTTARNCWR